ncbi:MAG TPA: PKD domain-containing protein, partial [Fluviicola sp.]|nr:PKD domain-containing protein [Fluviicola sp.]
TFTDANGCTNDDARVVTVISPTQAQAGPDFAVCIDAANVVLNPTPLGGTWTGTDVSPAGIFDPTTAGTFPLVYTFGSGACLTRDTLLATVYPLPMVDAGLPSSWCIDAGVQNLTGSPLAGTWTGTGITNPSGQFDPALAGAGTHTVTYTFTDGNSCTNSDQVALTVNPLPIVNAGNDTTVCDQPIPFQVVGTPSGGTWSGTNVTPTGQFTPNGTGSFTLTYTFTDANGCTNDDARVVTVVSVTPSNAGPDLEACINSGNVVLVATPVTGTWSGTNVTPSGLFSPISAGTFPLVYSNGAGNCLSRDTMLFTVHPLPIVNAGVDLAFCPTDLPVNLAATPVGGTWSGTGITNSTTGTFDPGVAPVGTHTITYTYTNPVTGCTNSDALAITVHPLPTASFTYNPITCVGTNENFTNTSTLVNQSNWDFGDGNTSSLQNPTHAYTAIGFYNIELVATTVFGCKDTVQQTIEVRDVPNALFSLVPDSACGPVTVNFTDLSVGQAMSYSWDYGNGQTSTSSTPTSQTYYASNYSDTTYFITLTLTNFCGSDTHNEQVQVMPSPTAVFGTNTNVGCTPLVLDIMDNSFGMPDTYQWDFGDGTTSNTMASTFQHTFTTDTVPTTYTIQLIVSNECGTDTLQHQITVNPSTVDAFFNIDNPSGCVNHTVHLTQYTTGANFTSWDFGDGNLSTAQNPSHTYTQPGTYEITLYAAGCGFDTAKVTVTVHPKPQIDFTTVTSLCQNETFAFTNLSSGIASINWDFGDGTSSTLTNPTHQYAAPGTYQVVLSGVSVAYGCTSSDTMNIVVKPVPSAQFTINPTTACVNEIVQLTSSGTGITNYAWDLGDGNISTAANPSHSYTSAGTYTIRLITYNASGCSDTTIQNIIINPLPIADFTYLVNNPCVQPTPVNFTNTSSGSTGYQWDFGNGTNSTLTNPTTTYNLAGNYPVELIVVNQFGCRDTIVKQVSSYNTPQITAQLSSDSVCINEAYYLYSTSLFADSIAWIIGGNQPVFGDSIQYDFGATGSYPVTVIGYGQGGCNDTIQLNATITVLPTPIAGFTYEILSDPVHSSGTVNFTNTSQEATNYQWDFGNGETSTDTNATTFYPSVDDYQVTLTAINQFGCKDTAQQIIPINFYYGLYIPNAMYPGHPDFEVANFVPKGVGLKEFELLIYDDWGNLIWSTSDLDADGRPTGYWDGTYNGEPVQQDAYVWKATAIFKNTEVWVGKEYPKGKIKRSGTVTVIR